MNNVTYKEIAKDLGKQEGTIKNWKKNSPVLLEYVKLGAFCKKNDLTIEKIQQLVKLQSMLKQDIKES
jgi:predicted transcriptional regulator